MAPDRFIPCTREIEIGDGVRYRPIRSWHSNTFAGERLTEVGGDRSGCMHTMGGRRWAPIPNTVTHRLYWHESDPERTVSAFLSYPGAMSSGNEYFWEANIDDCVRFFGPEAETECETAIKAELQKKEGSP